jgi:hypothetical protein
MSIVNESQIKKIMERRELLINELASIDKVLKELQKICSHKNEDGTTALKYAGKDKDFDYYRCHICGINIEE